MKGKRRRFTAEFKEEAVRPLVKGGRPLPRFARVDGLSGRVSLIEYSEDELEEIAETPAEPADRERYPRDGLAGYRAVEIKLSDLLAGTKEHRI